MPATPAVAAMPAGPADGHTVHVTAPHVVAGKVMGPYHHYCKVLSPEPVIECLCYLSNEPNARLEQVEYILAKSITRNGAVTLAGAGTASMLTERGIVCPGPPHPTTASASIAGDTDHAPCLTTILLSPKDSCMEVGRPMRRA